MFRAADLPTPLKRSDLVGRLLKLRFRQNFYMTPAKLQWKDSCRLAFKSLKLLTVPCLYNLETSLYLSLKKIALEVVTYTYGTRGRDNYQTGRHRTVLYERLPLGQEIILSTNVKCYQKFCNATRLNSRNSSENHVDF